MSLFADLVARKKVVLSALAVALVLVLTPYVRAQAVAVAEVDGYVTDPSGQAIPGAQIKITEINKHQVRTTVSNATGRYAFPDLPVGSYVLEVSSPGFKAYRQTGITLEVAHNIDVPVKMEIGTVSESVLVNANAEMVETKENAITQVIDEQRIVDLPLNGRNPADLIKLMAAGTSTMNLPGNDLTGSKNMQGSNGSQAFSVAGGQANGLNFLLDGGDNNDAFSNVGLPIPFPDAVQEFNVQTNALPAQYGLHPGGVVNIVTKSGGNAFHGDLFEFLRNGDLNARQEGTLVRDSLKRSQFGGTLGGRIIKDKLFFFGGYQGTRQRSDPAATVAHVSTAASIMGDFSVLDGARSAGGCQAAAKTLKNPFNNGAPFPGNMIPSNLFDTSAMKLLQNFIPVSSDPCGLYLYGQPSNNPDDQWIGRVDYIKSDKQTLYGRYFIYDYTAQSFFDGKNALTTGPNPGQQERSQTMTLGHTYTFSPTMLNSFHATFDRRRDNRGSAPNLFGPNDLGINMFQNTPNYIQLTITSYFNVGCGTCAQGYFDINTYQAADDFSWIHGKHQFAFGFDYRKDQFNSYNLQQGNGQITFSGGTTGDALADLMIGRMSQFVDGNALSDYLRQNVIAGYAQDTYHPTQHLTLNLGVRWEPSLPAFDKYDRGNQFNLGLFQQNVHSSVYPNAPAGLLFAGDTQNKNGKAFTASHWALFSPRIGVVWDPSGNGKQTISMAFGMMHETTELFYPERWTTNPPYASSVTLTSPTAPFSNPWLGYPGGNPFPGAAIFPIGGTYINIPSNVNPTYMMQWNLRYQRQIGKDWLFAANYLGNKTTHILGSYDIDYSIPIAGSSAATNNRRLLYLMNPTLGQYYSNIQTTDDGGNSHYNGLLVSIQHRFAHHFIVLSNYNYSHCISDVDFLGELAGPQYQNPTNRAAERGSCGFDHRQNFNTSAVFSSPGIGSSFAKRITADWQVSPIIGLFTGSPLTPTDGTKDISLSGQIKDRPNVVLPNQVYPANQTAQEFFNPLAFSAQAAGTFGNVGRGSIMGPGQINFDVAVSRLFPMTERFKLDFRADFFNIMNHGNFNNPTVDSTSSTFGQVTGFTAPRIIQLAMKFIF
ncbi:MAG TPA: TonB-dependent receptor [Bryobacteraceae bacterium]|nr:TonB-dependent receptor [Bryobacteraceae bacterium]